MNKIVVTLAIITIISITGVIVYYRPDIISSDGSTQISYCLNGGTYNVPFDTNENYWSLLVASGAEWIRIDIKSDVRQLQYFQMLKQYNLKVLAILAKSYWGSSECPDLNTWRNVLKLELPRYKNYIDALECWNEPDLPVFNSPVYNGDPTKYVDMLRVMKEEMVVVGLNVPLIAGSIACLAGNSQIFGDYYGEYFLRGIVNAGASNYCDAYSFHAYDWFVTGSSTPADLYNKAKGIVGNKPVWETEMGYNTSDEQISASKMTEWISSLKNVNCTFITWFLYYPTMSYENNYSIVTSSLTCKANYYAFQNLTNVDIVPSSMIVGVDIWRQTPLSDFQSSSLLLQQSGIKIVRSAFAPNCLILPSLIESGMQIIGILYNTNYANNPSGYADWCYNTVLQYKNSVHIWEVWNEPDWKTGINNVASYTQMLKAAYPKIKQADPNCKVLGGSISNCGNDGLNYLRGMYTNGAKGFMDALAVHPYCGIVSPTSTETGTGKGFWRVQDAHQIMIDNGDSSHIWITEFGWDTNKVTQEQQKNYIVEALNMAKSWSYVDVCVVYCWIDGGFVYGLLDSGLVPKLSYYSVKDWINLNK